MEITKADSISAQSKSTKPSNTLDKNAFLKILTVQLSNQDPLNAKDNTEYIAQMAQFSALEQMQNLNTNITKMLLSEKVTEGTSLIGKQVNMLSDNKNITAKVNSITIDKGAVILNTDKGKYDIDLLVGAGENLDSTNINPR